MNERSLMVIKQADATVFSDVLAFMVHWCKTRNLEAFVRNVPDGYEIVAKPMEAMKHEYREAYDESKDRWQDRVLALESELTDAKRMLRDTAKERDFALEQFHTARAALERAVADRDAWNASFHAANKDRLDRPGYCQACGVKLIST